jgi:hypothetical protein
MKLWGQDYTHHQLEALTGDFRQIADIRLGTLEDGLERGARTASVRTGSGLDFVVLLDRAMDIGTATFHGVPLAWQSGSGAVHPSYYEPEGVGWRRTFHGGLLALCGLTHAGHAVPSEDPENGEPLGLHGRIGHIPAYDIQIHRQWSRDSDEWTMRLSGTVDELVIFGYRLQLTRELEFTVGRAEIRIHDEVRNLGGFPSPLMVFYHCNLGWPIISPESLVTSPATEVLAATPASQVADWQKMQEPTPGYKEQVFTHVLPRSETPLVAAVSNPRLQLGVEFAFDSRTLNYMTQWKQMGFRDYVMGIEPANCLPEGRVRARAAGRLRMLAPDEAETFSLAIRVIGENALFQSENL